MANLYWLTGDYDEAIPAARRALSAAQVSGSLGLRILANFRLAQVYHSLGQYGRAVDYTRDDIQALAGDLVEEHFGGVGVASVQSRTWSILCHAELGNFSEATAQAEEGVRVAERLSDSYDFAHLSFSIGLLHIRKGDLPKAIVVLADELGMRPLAARCHLGLGKLYGLSGRQDEAHNHLAFATTMYHEMGMPFWLEKAEAEMKGLL